MRLGLFGGTFDPVHVGHLDVARAAIDAVGLDELHLVPARMPPHRHQPHASAAHRFAMAALAASSEARVRVSDVEMTTEGPSYTIDTLSRVIDAGLTVPASLFFVIGADAFGDIASWRAYPQVLDRCHFVVVSRPGRTVATLPQQLPAIADRMTAATLTSPTRPSILLVDAATSPVSSTRVRLARQRGESLAGLVPPAVADYIQRQRLYLDSTETPHA